MIDKFLEELFGNVESELKEKVDQKEEIPAGTLSDHTRILVRKMHREMDGHKEEIGDIVKKMKLEIDKIQSSAQREAEEHKDQIELLHHAQWDRICKELQLDPDGEYSLNTQTGVVSQLVPKTNSGSAFH